jgi:hypothetical protein
MPHLPALLTTLPVLLVTLPQSPVLAQSQGRAINLELDLATDGSSSFDDGGVSLLRDRYGQAMMHPWGAGGDPVRFTIPHRRGLCRVGPPKSQHTIVDWTFISERTSAVQFA